MVFDIRRFDVYRKIPKDLTQPTLTGAIISLGSGAFILYLFLAELKAFVVPEIVSELFVDDPVRHDQRIAVKIDISLPHMDCKFIGLDIQDEMGRHEVGFVENVQRIPLDEGKGCRFKANFKINKVPGNFHISTHSSREQPEASSMAHIVHEITFGDAVPDWVHLVGSFNPLQEHDKSKANAESTHDYYMKVVPTVYETTGGDAYFPYQYTFAGRDYIQYGHGHRTIPAVWFRYDLSPITVKYSEKRPPFYHFLTTVCAIIGGTFTVAGIIDSMIFTASEVFKKAELGKLS